MIDEAARGDARRYSAAAIQLAMQKMPATLSFVEPMECKPVDKLPEGEEWQHEIKFDGYRAIAVKQYGEVNLFSRRGNSFNADYAETVKALNTLRAKSFVLDGELVALDDRGRHSFSLLQNAKRKLVPVVFYAFDLLTRDDENLMARPLETRRRQLEEAFPKWPALVQLSPRLLGTKAARRTFRRPDAGTGTGRGTRTIGLRSSQSNAASLTNSGLKRKRIG